MQQTFGIDLTFHNRVGSKTSQHLVSYTVEEETPPLTDCYCDVRRRLNAIVMSEMTPCINVTRWCVHSGARAGTKQRKTNI